MSRLRALSARFRPDHLPRPRLHLPALALTPSDGWCDDAASARYNRPVRLPFTSSHEQMWRDDALYDLVVDLSWNRGPILKGRGSAIFLHAARRGFTPTEGCVAVVRRLLPRLAGRIGRDTILVLCERAGERPVRRTAHGR